jgi:hypothetical protein
LRCGFQSSPDGLLCYVCGTELFQEGEGSIRSRLLSLALLNSRKDLQISGGIFLFDRYLVRNEEMLISVDEVFANAEPVRRPYWVMEIKVRKNLDLMKKAMRFAMLKLPVVQTTRSKCEM